MPIGTFRLNTLSAAVSDVVSSITATGGTISYIQVSGSTYKLHTFTTTGSSSFVVSSTTGSPTVDLLLVGGGGGGGGTGGATGTAGGGGGGGAVKYQTSVGVSSQTYTVTVGAGGGSSGASDGSPGSSSSALGYTANGGGAGSLFAGATDGGGSGSNSATSFVSTAGTYSYKGGNGFGSSTGSSRASGGGAGAGQAGSNGASSAGGNGGIGVQNNIDGNNYYYGSGGGGSGSVSSGNAYDRTNYAMNGAGFGSGRIGTGAGYSATDPLAPYGAGGGGALAPTTSNNYAGGSGKQGIAMIRYPLTTNFSLSYVTSATSTGSSITIPATAQIGDIAILVDFAYVSGSNTLSTLIPPTGFTQFSQSSNSYSNSVSSSKTVVSYKILTSGNPGSSVSGGTVTNAFYNKIIMIYRPNNTINSISTVNSYEYNGTNSSSGTLTLSSQKPWHIGLAVYASEVGNITTRGSTTSSTRELNNGTKLYVRLFEGLDGSTTFTDSTISIADYGYDNTLLGYIANIS